MSLSNGTKTLITKAKLKQSLQRRRPKNGEANGQAQTIMLPNTIPYDDGVREGKAIIAKHEASRARMMWRLGELADRLEPRYGEKTRARFAEAIGMVGCTLDRICSTYRAWKDEISAPGPNLSWAAMRVLVDHPKRAEIVNKNPNITKREAEAECKKQKQPTAKRETKPDSKAETQRWFTDLLVRVNHAVRDLKMTEGRARNRLQRLELQEVIEPALLPTLRQGGEAWIKLANNLEAFLRDGTWPEEAAHGP